MTRFHLLFRCDSYAASLLAVCGLGTRTFEGAAFSTLLYLVYTCLLSNFDHHSHMFFVVVSNKASRNQSDRPTLPVTTAEPALAVRVLETADLLQVHVLGDARHVGGVELPVT